MNALFVLIFTCGGALAIGRGLDLALWTDWNTGLCTAGSVWLRYGGLWAALCALSALGLAFLGRKKKHDDN